MTGWAPYDVIDSLRTSSLRIRKSDTETKPTIGAVLLLVSGKLPHVSKAADLIQLP